MSIQPSCYFSHARYFWHEELLKTLEMSASFNPILQACFLLIYDFFPKLSEILDSLGLQTDLKGVNGISKYF